jgi:hypothetical protein
MPAHGHVTVWGTHVGVGRAPNAQGWYQQLQDWWAAHRAARQEAKLATLKARWDARHESICVLHADSASDMVAAAHARSTATALCDLTI